MAGMDASAADDLVLVGTIERPHGLRGEVVVNPLTDFGGERFVPGATLSEQSVPQLMPAPVERMLPLPLTVVLSKTAVLTCPGLKLAVTWVVPFRTTVHAGSVPVQPPLQELKT